MSPGNRRLGLSTLYVGLGDTDAVEAIFLGLAPAVIAIVIQAVVRVSRRALTSSVLVGPAVAAFIALAFFAVPSPVVILTAGAFGWLLSMVRPELAAEAGSQ